MAKNYLGYDSFLRLMPKVARDDALCGLYFYKNLFPRFVAGLEAKKERSMGFLIVIFYRLTYVIFNWGMGMTFSVLRTEHMIG
jgi:hypothetical protein